MSKKHKSAAASAPAEQNTPTDFSVSENSAPDELSDQSPPETEAEAAPDSDAASNTSQTLDPPPPPTLRTVRSPLKVHGQRWQVGDQVAIDTLHPNEVERLTRQGIIE